MAADALADLNHLPVKGSGCDLPLVLRLWKI